MQAPRAPIYGVRMKQVLAFVVFVALVGAFLLPGACSSSAVTGREQLLLFSPSVMDRIGSQTYAEMTGPGSKARLLSDAAQVAPLLEVGAAIAAAAAQPGYAWEFRLIDAPGTANAFALPGGRIAFYTGIYPVLQDRAGMAIVMGHEVMHAVLQHGNERMSQAVLAQLGLVAADFVLEDNKHKAEIMAALGVGVQLGVMLPYSRAHETEADEQGLYLAARAGFDPQAAIGVWERMAALGKGDRPPELLSTHPDPLTRIEAMRAWMPRALELYAASTKQPNSPLVLASAAK